MGERLKIIHFFLVISLKIVYIILMIKTILNTLHDSIACLTFVALGYITAYLFFVPFFFAYMPNWQCIFAFPFLMFAIMAGFYLNSRG